MLKLSEPDDGPVLISSNHDAQPDPAKMPYPRNGYVIMAGPYKGNSAGIHCLHTLCHELNRSGFPSFVSLIARSATVQPNHKAPQLDAPLVDRNAAESLCRSGYTAIYPETILGNPLRAQTVVRWVLNRPGHLGGATVFDDSEFVFYYSTLLLPYIRNRVVGKLYMPTIDETLFYCDDESQSRRSLECFYVGKSRWKDGICDPSRAIEITRCSPAKTELGKIFRSSRVLYCFDNCTAISYEALFCGCKVVIVPDGTQTKEDYQRYELGTEGLAWGMEELEQIQTNVPALRRRYLQVKSNFQSELTRLIESTSPDNHLIRQRFSRSQFWLSRCQRSFLDSVHLAFGLVRREVDQLEKMLRHWKKTVVKDRVIRPLKQIAGSLTLKVRPPQKIGFVFVTPPFKAETEDYYCIEMLCNELNRRGVPSFAMDLHRVAIRDRSRIDFEWAKALCACGYTAIYPDSVSGNPLKAKSIVRWVLNRPGTWGGDANYDESEHVFCASEMFLPYIQNRLALKLYPPPIDENDFRCVEPDSAARSIDCYYLGKSQWRDGALSRSNVFQITTEIASNKDLGKLLRSSRFLYMFEFSTDLVTKALLSGCKVVVIPDGKLGKDDLQRFEFGSEGIAWSEQETPATSVDVQRLFQRYTSLKQEFDSQIEQLIATRRMVG